MIDYRKRLVEVDEVLKHMSKIDFEKIPENIRNIIKKIKDPDYIWVYDCNKGLCEQGLSRDTIIILSYLNMEYMLDDNQKQLMKEIHEFNEMKSLKVEESQKLELKFEPQKEEMTALINTEEDLSFFAKVIKKIKSIFNKK